MATKVHLSKISHRPGVTVTGTLCNRMRSLADGFNCTEVQADVTCKFCLKIIAAKAWAASYTASLQKPRAA